MGSLWFLVASLRDAALVTAYEVEQVRQQLVCRWCSNCHRPWVSFIWNYLWENEVRFLLLRATLMHLLLAQWLRMPHLAQLLSFDFFTTCDSHNTCFSSFPYVWAFSSAHEGDPEHWDPPLQSSGGCPVDWQSEGERGPSRRQQCQISSFSTYQMAFKPFHSPHFVSFCPLTLHPLYWSECQTYNLPVPALDCPAPQAHSASQRLSSAGTCRAECYAALPAGIWRFSGCCRRGARTTGSACRRPPWCLLSWSLLCAAQLWVLGPLSSVTRRLRCSSCPNFCWKKE